MRSHLILLALLLVPRGLHPCASAPPMGSFVRIQEESAIIVWDSAKKIQHLIRRASFQSDAPDFGFLVPTPTKPELSEVSNDAFQVLDEVMQPKVVEVDETGIRPMWLVGEFLYAGRGYETSVGAVPQVRMLEMKQVAGYDAVVLEADDASALNGWLQEHGYPASPALQKWFEPYVAMRWKITAFKIAGNKDSGTAGSSTVRMSFAADRPFFPYREPESDTDAKEYRLLQVLLLSDERMDGVLGDAGAWPGRLRWADRVPSEDQTRLMKKLGLEHIQLPERLWLCAFEDPSSPRSGHNDLFFQRAANQSADVPPPYVIRHDRRIPIPIDLLLLIGVIVAIVIARRRK